MPDKGWLKIVLDEARRDVNSRPEWQKDRVLAGEDCKQPFVNEPQRVEITPVSELGLK
jgi:hypothetical protein